MGRNWSKKDAFGLTRFVNKRATEWLGTDVSRYDLLGLSDGRRQVVEDLYNQLVSRGIRYALEEYHPSQSMQRIRSPREILETRSEATCLDLATLFSGLCLGNDLLPIIVVLQGHALVLVDRHCSLTDWNAASRFGAGLFADDPVLRRDSVGGPEKFVQLVQFVEGGRYLAIECTGVARSERLGQVLERPMPESIGRTSEGVLPFERAVDAGLEQLRFARAAAERKWAATNREFLYAVDIAAAHYGHNADIYPVRATFFGDRTTDKVESLLSEYTDVFVGRDDAKARLDRFVDERPSGHLVITAQAGYGKTALLANWLEQHRTAQDRFLAYHFFRHSDNDLRTVEQACWNLLQQLQRYDTDEHGERESGPDPRERLYTFIKDRGGRHRRLVIVLDALDEAIGDLKKLFPDPLPPGVFVIVSARAQPEELPEPLADWVVGTEPPMHLDRLPDLAIAQWLSRSTEPALRELANDQQFVALLSDRTAGFPLYLHYLMGELEELSRESEHGKNLRQVLTAKPKGFATYFKVAYQRLWDNLLAADSEAMAERLWGSLALLSVAKGPLYEAELVAIMGPGLRRRHFSPLRYSRELRRWLHLTEDGEGYAYAFDQRLLAEEFVRNWPDDAEDALVKLLEWCAGKQAQSAYGLRHFAEHLLDAVPDRVQGVEPPPEREVLYRLARDQHFLEAQFRRFPREPSLSLRTIQAALQAAAKTQDAAGMAEFLLVHLRHLIEIRDGHSPLEALEAEELDWAWVLVDLMDVERCVLWHMLMAWVLAETGRRQAAAATLRRLLERDLPPLAGWHAQAAVLLLAAGPQVDSGIFTSLLEHVLNDRGRLDVLVALLSRPPSRIPADLVRSGWLASVQQAAEAVKDPELAAYSSVAAARACGKLGYSEGVGSALSEAREAANLVEVAPCRVGALAEVAQTCAELGDLETAREIIADIHNSERPMDQAAERPTAWNWVLRQLALAQAATDDVATARRTILAIGSSVEQAEALLDLGRQLAKGNHERAPAILALARDVARRIGVRQDWSSAADAFSGLRETVEEPPTDAASTIKRAILEVEGHSNWGRAFLGPVDGGAGAGPTLATVRAAADKIPSPEERGPILIAVARVQAESGQVDDAASTFAAARRAGANVQDHARRGGILGACAHAQLAAGLAADGASTFGLAREAALSVADTSIRRDLIVLMHRLQAEAGQLDLAQHAASRLEDPTAQANILLVLAWMQRDTGRDEEVKQAVPAVLEAAVRIDDPEARCLILLSAAQLQVQVNQPAPAAETFDLARKAAVAVPATAARLDLLVRVCEAQVTAGQLELAQEASNQLDDSIARARTFSAVGLARLAAGQQAAGSAALKLALQAAQSLPNANERTVWLGFVAQRCAQAGQAAAATAAFEAAQSAANDIDDVAERGAIIAYIVDLKLQSGELAAARQAAGAIADAEFRVFALIRVAEQAARTGRGGEAAADFWSAYDSAKEVPDVVDRAAAMAEVATSWARSLEDDNLSDRRPDTKQARVFGLLVASLKPDQLVVRQDTLGAAWIAAQELAENGGQTTILDTIELLRADPQASGETLAELRTRRIDLLVSIAYEELAVGEADGAKTTLTRALESAKQFEETEFRARVQALTDIAVAQVRAGQKSEADAIFELASKPATKAPEPHARAWALWTIALAEATSREADSFEAAVTAAWTIPGVDRVKALAVTGREQARTGDAEAARATWGLALEATKELELPADAAVALEFLALQQASAGDDQAAWQAALMMPEPWAEERLSSIGMAIAKAQAAKGQVQALRQTVARMLAPSPRDHRELAIWALATIARVQARLGAVDEARRTAGWISDGMARQATLTELAAAGAESTPDGADRLRTAEVQAMGGAAASQLGRTPSQVVGPPQSEGAVIEGVDTLRKKGPMSATGLAEALRVAQGPGEMAAPRVIPATLGEDSGRRLASELLHRAAAALKDPGQRGSFERLLPSAAYFPLATYCVLPLLALVYPNQSTRVAGVVSGLLSTDLEGQAAHDLD